MLNILRVGRREARVPALLALVGALILGGAGPRGEAEPTADPPTASAPTACGRAVSAAVLSAWEGLGGESGRLGCPTTRESASSPSPLGTTGRVAVFGLNGEIVLHASGPRAGQAFVVSGCFYRLYVQFGGTDGWLGLPVADAINTPDGSRQAFEGGLMRYARALDECEATPSPARAESVAPSTREESTREESPRAESPAAETALDLFEDPATGDRLSLAAPGSVERAVVAGYQRLRTQARVLSQEQAGATPLKLYSNESTNVRETLASAQSEREALATGFAFEASQGFIWTDPRPGAVALKLFRDPASGRVRLTASETDDRDAIAKGYAFVRMEGYADPAP
jgi:uncharacterized protein with LGFP repeats